MPYTLPTIQFTTLCFHPTEYVIFPDPLFHPRSCFLFHFHSHIPLLFFMINIYFYVLSYLILIAINGRDRSIRSYSGKASEGIDFRNNKGRVVIITGADFILDTAALPLII